MKRFLILACCLIFGAAVNAQSKRKLNKQLTAQYTALDQKVDSLTELSIALGDSLDRLKPHFDSVLAIHKKIDYEFSTDRSGITDNVWLLRLNAAWPIAGIRETLFDSVTNYPDYPGNTSISKANKVTRIFGFSKSEHVYAAKGSVSERNDRLLLGIKIREKEAKTLDDEVTERRTALSVYGKEIMLLEERIAEISALSPAVKEMKLSTTNTLQQLLKTYELNDHKKYDALLGQMYGTESGALPVTKEAPVERMMPEESMISNLADEDAEFPGGPLALQEYLKANVKLPEDALSNGIIGKLHFRFIVYSDGHIGNVSIVRGFTDCQECDEEYLRVIQSMPNWIPGKINGKAINQLIHLPIKF